MKKVLITGAKGFIGKNLAEGLRQKYTVYTPGHSVLDLLEEEQVKSYLKKEQFDVVIHGANTNPVMHPELGQFEQLDYNLKMFFNIVKNRDCYGKMYYFGSGMEYDSRYYQPLMEETYFGTHIPVDAYGFSKYIMARTAMEQDNNIYDLRLFGVYGRYEEWKRRFISNVICQALKGRQIMMNQNMYLDYLYIEDLTKIMCWFIEHKPKYKCYNVCTSMPEMLVSLARIVERETKSSRGIFVKKPGYKPEYSGDNHRLKEELGEFKFTDYETGIQELIQYYEPIIDELEL